MNAFLEADREVFAGYSLTPSTHELKLAKPDVTLRAIELGSGEPALFLHGLGGSATSWAPLMARVPAMHKFAIDMPGHGASTAVDFKGVDLRNWFRQLITGCLDELGVDSAHIIGHSMSAMFGLWLALDAPQRVRSLVAIGTPAAAFGEGRPPVFLQLLSRPGIGQLMLSMPTPLFMYRREMASFLGRHAVESVPAAFIRASHLGSRGAGPASTLSSLTVELFRGVRAQPPRYVLTPDELGRIRKPVLIVWGSAEDGMVMPIAEAKEKAALIPNARFEVLQGGHMPWLDDPQGCADLVNEFHSRFAHESANQPSAPSFV